MRHLVLLLALFLGMAVYQFSTVDLPTQPLPPVLQQPDPLPQVEVPRHDKWREQPRAYCFHGKAGTAMPGNEQAHACECARMCATGNDGQRSQMEQSNCEMYCTVSRCLCHADESCELPEIKP